MLKNVIILNDFGYVNGGASQVALSSAIGLSREGINVVLLTAAGPVEPRLSENGVKVHCIEQFEILKDPNRARALIQGLWNIESARTLCNVLNDYDPSSTLVHLHSWTKALSSSVVRMARKKGYRIVCTLHDYFTVCPNGTLFVFSKNSICKLKPLSPKCIFEDCDRRSYGHKIWRVIRQMVQNNIGLVPKHIRSFITVTRFSENILRQYLPKDSKFTLICNPIEATKTEPVPVGKNNIHILVGRLSKEKGVIPYIRVAKDAGLKTVFVGDGECRDDVLRIDNQAEISGWVNRDVINEYLNRARVLLFPSLWYETQGMVVLEAAARGVPSLIPDTCAASDFIIDGMTGLLYEGGNYEDLLRKIRLLQDDAFVDELGKRAYENYWSNPYTLHRHTSELLNLYKAVLENG